MNYYNFVKQIKEISLANDIVNETGEGDIYLHLNSGMHKYPCVFLTVQNITFANDIVNVNGTLFYVDRLLDNSANKVEIQSNALTALSQIFDRIAEETVINIRQNTYTPFDEKFADLCAGQFATFQASFPNDVICSDDNFEIKTITLNHNGIYDIIGYDHAVVAVEGGKWGQITGNIEEQTDLINLVEDTVGNACECVNEAKQEVLDAIDEIDIDTTELAKQGTDANANITDITEKLQQIIGANILRPNLQGITFVDGYATDNVADILMNIKYYIENISSESELPIRAYDFYACTQLRTASFPNVTNVGTYAFYRCTRLVTININNVTSIYDYAFSDTGLSTCYAEKTLLVGTQAFRNCASLKYLDISDVATINTNAFQGDTNLIDIHMGRNITTSINLGGGTGAIWQPTNAYSSTSNNLVPADVLEEHPTWKNAQYLLYCLREHFAANLPTLPEGSTQTITVHSTMKNLINGHPMTAAAFTNKNWTIA